MFEKKYVLIFLAFFLHLLPHMLKLATDYFNFSRRHWLFTTLVMCAATADVLGNVDPLIQYMDCIDILCNTIKKLNRYVFVIQYIASPKYKVLFSATTNRLQ